MKGDNKKISKILFPLVLLMIMLLPSTYTEGAMSDYCLVPPFLAQSISPNVLIVLDNSGSMCGQAYAGSYDPTQFKDGYYYGYFDGSKNYQYTGNNRWEVTTALMNTGTVSNPIATGSFLNWAAMRRVDVSKKLLIGGKADPRSWNGAVTVKLLGETACDRDFDKTYDTSAGNLIYPFVGNYLFDMDNSDNLTISPIVGGTNTYPTSDISVPWNEFPTGGAVTAWDKVDEVAADADTTYISNNNTTNSVIMGFNYTQAEPAGVISVTVQVRARKTTSNQRNIQGVFRVDGANHWPTTSSLTTSYSNYSFTFANNPATLAPWTWDQIKNIAASGNLQGFGVKAASSYSSNSIRATQVYLRVTVTTPTGGPFNTIVDQGKVKAEGIIDTLTSDVRFGLAYYDDDGSVDNGAEIAAPNTYIGFGVATNMITSMHNMTPSTWTPLGETLYEMTRFFRQDNPYYEGDDYSLGGNGANIIRDPYWYKLSDLDAGYTDQYVPCAKSFILFLTDGESTHDQSMPGSSTSSPYAACSLTNIKACSGYGIPDQDGSTAGVQRFAGTTIGTTYSDEGTDYMIDVAYWARTNDMRTGACGDVVPTSWQQCLPGTQNVTLYPVFMFGTGSTLLKDASIYGGFDDLNGDNKPDCTTRPEECYRDTDGDGVVESNGQDDPLTYYEGDDGAALETSITNAINDILRRASSGTAASVLASGGEHGANILQAVFYPKRPFTNGTVDWTGTLQNLWFYIDPFFNAASIREDTDQNSILNLKNDYVLRFRFDVDSQTTKADLFEDINGDYTSLVQKPSVEIEKVMNLWEAGKILWQRDISAAGDPRNIKTFIGGPDFKDFSIASRTDLRPYLQAADDTESEAIIRYIHGEDTPFNPAITPDGDAVPDFTGTYRNRTAGFDLSSPPDGDTIDAGETNVWKLGDIISSTPRVSSRVPLNTYDIRYLDTSYEKFICKNMSSADCAAGSGYNNRGTVFTGANDGMLHAFKLGRVLPSKNKIEPASIINLDTGLPCDAVDTNRCGSEIWAFIPKHVLPYLKYNADIGYCHLFNVDGIPYIFDASIGEASDLERKTDGSSWRTILIGSMKLGGACRNKGVACNDGSINCVNTPVDNLGYSSYFAIDITDNDPDNWKLLWEFSDENIPAGELADGGLGFSTSSQAVVRINPAQDTCKDSGGGDIGDESQCNGEWFVLIPSGPTGPIDTATKQFMGRSDQKLKVFVINLRDGAYRTAIKSFGGEIDNAFGGSILSSVLDPDIDYQDDAVYLGYINSANNVDDNTWTNGGVVAVMTKEDADPLNWAGRKIMDGIGPVTSSVDKLQNIKTDKLWLYFGTGRYFFKQFGVIDDAATQRRIYGVQDPCYLSSSPNLDPGESFDLLTCSGPVSQADLNDVTDIDLNNPPAEDDEGWFINLDASDADYDAERLTTNPVASTIGATFFATFKPTADICGYGGKSYLWAVKAETGGTATSLLEGKALMQVSTGAIEEKYLKDAFKQTEPGGSNPDSHDDRRTGAMVGKPPDGPGLILLTAPPPTEKVLHMREK